MTIQLTQVLPGTPLFREVLRLGKVNRQRLGFLPKGAFAEHASKNGLIAATLDGEELCGYLLFRNTSTEAAIIHLCVDSNWINQGIAHQLLGTLKRKTLHFPGIGLWCRDDYNLSSFWKKNKFTPIAKRGGRGRGARILTKWWFDHGHHDLFNNPSHCVDNGFIVAIMDSCVFFAMDDSKDANHAAAHALFSDRLNKLVDLRVTNEIFNDICRDINTARCIARMQRAHSFLLKSDPVSQEKVSMELQEAIPLAVSDQDRSDIQHIAATISRGIAYFITFDVGFRRIPTDILSTYNLRIITPSQFILHIDELIREREYFPQRAQTYELQWQRVRSSALGELYRFFCADGREKKAQWDARLSALCHQPERQTVEMLNGASAGHLGILGYDIIDNVMHVNLMRTTRTQLSSTILRFLISRTIFSAKQKGVNLVRLQDLDSRSDVSRAAHDLGFIEHKGLLFKLLLNNVDGWEQIPDQINRLAQIQSITGTQKDMLIQYIGDGFNSPQDCADCEHLFFPMKICNASLPTFVVPIAADWALHLFDTQLAEQDLLGGVAKLALNLEAVYYRSPLNHGGLRSPGRIVWYVCDSNKYVGAGSIRACSRLTGVEVDMAKDVFKRNSRLGIYEWEDVKQSCDRKGKVMALHFDDTEQYPNPMPFSKIKHMFPLFSCPANFASPRLITAECFQSVHAYCTKKVSA